MKTRCIIDKILHEECIRNEECSVHTLLKGHSKVTSLNGSKAVCAKIFQVGTLRE